MDNPIANAIETAWNPSSNPNLKAQAVEFVNRLRADPSGWEPCLSIFMETPRRSEVVRHFALEVVNSALQMGVVDTQGLDYVKRTLLLYVQQNYGYQGVDSKPDGTSIQNKLAQTITYVFSTTYATGWRSFFDDLLSLTHKAPSNSARDNPTGIILYLRVINSIHDEIGDVLLSRSRAEQDKANTLKDLIRQRDVRKIVSSWQELLSQWHDGSDIIVELCLKAVGSYVSWIDISLVLNQAMLDLLFHQVARAQNANLREGEEKVRDTAIDVFTEIVAKKMKPADKIDMIAFLNLENVVSRLVASPSLEQRRFSSQYDTDFAETVAKLVNITVIDIVKALDAELEQPQSKQKAETLLQGFLPLMLRFFSDEYDEICSTVIPSMNDLLSFLRKTTKANNSDPQQYAPMTLPILKAIIAKMRYDETSSWGDEDEQTDEAEFQELRKRLNVLQQMISAVDKQLYTDVISELVSTTFGKLGQVGSQLDWRDLDLALHEMYLFGDLAVQMGRLYNKNKPNSEAADRLVQMMLKMVESDIRSFNHPATQLQYMEICVRYNSFFEHHAHLIPPVLENFLRLVHHPVLKLKTRSWYLFQRFVRHLRAHIGNVAQTVIEALSDLLTIQAELPSEGGDTDDMSSEDHDQSADAIFNSQLYLFEAIGCICGTLSVPVEKQVYFAQSVMNPIFTDMERNLPRAKSGDEQSILQIHHDIMALGTLARGFSDWTPGRESSVGPAREVSDTFSRVAEATLVALESLKTSFNIRTGARFAFSRLIGVIGSHILPQLPRWIDGLMTQTSTKDEMALFLRLLDQVIFGFKTEIYGILDTLLTPFLQRVFTGIADPTSGTDDEIQLAELKREYLNFLLVILNNDLGSVIVSNTNQPIFETVIGTIEHFAKDIDDFPTAKMAFQVVACMSSRWGGPDIARPPSGVPNGVLPPADYSAPQPSLPGFDRFMIARFSPLCWALLTTPSFNPKDAQARQVLAEAANLQKAIYSKTGSEYLTWLRDNELRGMGMNNEMIEEYLRALRGFDGKSFRQFFQSFVQRSS